MEKQLFTWEDWDEAGDPGDLQFYECELKEGVFPQLKQRKYSVAFISF